MALKTFINMSLLSVVLSNPQNHRWGHKVLTKPLSTLPAPSCPVGLLTGRQTFLSWAGCSALLGCPLFYTAADWNTDMRVYQCGEEDRRG